MTVSGALSHSSADARSATPLPALAALSARYRADPRFACLLKAYCSTMTEAPEGAWPFAKLFNQFARYMVCYMLIHNYYAWRLGGGPPPTLAVLQRSVPSSPRQAAGFIAALKAGRLVEAMAMPEDRRTKLLRPEEAVIRAVGRSGFGFIVAAEHLEGRGAPLAERLAAQPEALGELLYRSAAFVRAHGTLIDPFPRILTFARRDCGYLVLCAVMGAHYESAAEHAPSLSLKALAERFRISPAHVGNLLQEAQGEGWFRIGPRGRLKEMDHGLVDEFERWASWQMAHYRTLAATLA
ncbi:MAG: hypothetical protein AB1698_10955 [Pseudomonadota bacterium]